MAKRGLWALIVLAFLVGLGVSPILPLPRTDGAGGVATITETLISQVGETVTKTVTMPAYIYSTVERTVEVLPRHALAIASVSAVYRCNESGDRLEVILSLTSIGQEPIFIDMSRDIVLEGLRAPIPDPLLETIYGLMVPVAASPFSTTFVITYPIPDGQIILSRVSGSFITIPLTISYRGDDGSVLASVSIERFSFSIQCQM